MSVQYAILGLLSWRPFSGYELKKVIAASNIFYWSGNNNQIYTALVQLHEQGWVTQEIEYQDSLPAKKIYAITAKGREALRRWLLAKPELPEFRNPSLVQLAWADILDGDELDDLLASYEEELRVQMLMQKEQTQRQGVSPARTPREAYLWQMIDQNAVSTYESELKWVRKLREGLKRF
jgi:PadR family transcriptional regulator AphA